MLQLERQTAQHHLDLPLESMVETGPMECADACDGRGDNRTTEKAPRLPRRKERINKYTGDTAEREGLPWNCNANRLQIQAVPDMGLCLFAKEMI